ncbi:hypothetical protein Bca101_095860 [Brassica carinata]
MFVESTSPVLSLWSIDDFPVPGRPNNTNSRGQPQSNIDVSAFAHLPEGPVRSASIVKVMRAAEMNFRCPVRHGVLGIPGYVQFTSPIRRYMDLTAHYQVKRFHPLMVSDDFDLFGYIYGVISALSFV